MTTTRIVEETVCEHGDTGPHGIGINARIAGRVDCPGGSRRVLTEGQYVLIEKVDGEWRDEDAQKVIDWIGMDDSAENLDIVGMGILDALSDHTEGTP